MNLTFYEALDRIPLGIAVTIEFVGPLGVAVALSRRRLDLVWVAARRRRHRAARRPVGGGGLDPVGLLFGSIAAVFWAVYIVLAARAAQRFDGARARAGDGRGGARAARARRGQAGADLLGLEILALGALVALLSSVIPYSLETEALRRLPPHVFGVLMSLEPAVAALAGFLVLGQGLGARELVAIGLVIAASVGVTRTSPRLVPEP